MANGASRESKLTFTPPFGRDNVRRPKTAYACVFCRRSHMTCDDGRPCQRCIKRRIGHLCHDTHGLQLDGAPVPHSPVSDGVERDLKIGQEGSTPEGASVEMYEGFYLPANSPHPAQMTFPDCNDLCSRFARVCEEFNFCLETRNRVAAVSASIRQVSTFIQEHLDEKDLLESSRYTLCSLMEFNRIVTAIATPFLVIRGTGEILQVNDTFSNLVQLSRQVLTNGWRFCQLLTEEAFVNFCEKVVTMYFDTKQHALLTSCVLVPGGARQTLRNSPGGRSSVPVTTIPCSICATVRRDMFNLPVLVAITVIPMTDAA